MTDYSLMAKFNPEEAVKSFIEDQKITTSTEIRKQINISQRKLKEAVASLERSGEIAIKVVGTAKIITYND